ncbi:MAG: hypothetical protein LRZ85_08875 [Alphaproteobacteria bacterium]|nr:hypothetical protein [Alphaproteobacteria bacterium]
MPLSVPIFFYALAMAVIIEKRMNDIQAGTGLGWAFLWFIATMALGAWYSEASIEYAEATLLKTQSDKNYLLLMQEQKSFETFVLSSVANLLFGTVTHLYFLLRAGEASRDKRKELSDIQNLKQGLEEERDRLQQENEIESLKREIEQLRSKMTQKGADKKDYA